MPKYEQQLASLLEDMIQTYLQAQALRVREQWEPRVTGLLTNAADAVAHKLRPELAGLEAAAQDPAGRAALGTRAGQIVFQTAMTQAQRAADVLTDMVVQEVNEALMAVTINGLGREMPTLGLDGLGGREAARRLAGGDALAAAVARSARELTARLGGLWAPLAGGGQLAGGPAQRLDMHLAWWRSRLAAIAATVVHGVFNRVKQAAMQAAA